MTTAMTFRTLVEPLRGRQGLIDHDRPVVMVGSCFTDNVGARLVADGFDCSINPCGTLYNPASMAQAVLDLLYGRAYAESDLFLFEERWRSFTHHSRFALPTQEATLEAMNGEAERARQMLGRASVLVVTFGTSWMFRLKSDGRVVANCHKQPSDMFSREMLTSQQTAGLWKKIVRELHARHPQLRIVFTVSPIRHLADGSHGNQLSKSSLLLAIEQLVADFPDRVSYFPAYEIMMDDLRDYRFYAADMTHPSDVAVDYIYGLFMESFMTSATQTLAKEHRRQSRRQSHRPILGG